MKISKTFPLLLLVAFTPLHARQDAPPAAPSVVPFKMLPSNHMVVEAKLNGKGPFRFIFDLGAPVTLLSNRAAEASGAIDKSAPKSFLMGTRGEGKVKTLEMGKLKADDVPVIVMDHPAVKALSGFFEKPIEGIIGYTFWARFRMSIDYKDLQLTFEPVDFQVRDLMKELPQRLAGPKVAKTIILAPRGIWGIELGEPRGVETPGVPIAAVLPGSAAEMAGLKSGDILTSLDGRWTTTFADTFAAAASAEPGKPATVVVTRDGQDVTLTVTPREGL